MLNSTLSVLLVAAAATLATPEVAQAQAGKAAPTKNAAPIKGFKSGHVEVDGIRYYYEIQGEGKPLLLLHGGLGSIGMFRPILPILAADRQIIGVDLQGHGRTALGDRP